MATTNNKGKLRGNAEERKIAKQLSDWLFDDTTILRRSADSGALKTAYCGDVVPVKQLINYWPYDWPFMVEIKTGYQDHLPNFYNYKTVKNWFIKAEEESIINKQWVVLLITRFKYKKPLLFTNYYITRIPLNVIMPIYDNKNNMKLVYVYNFYDMLEYKYNYVFNMESIVT